MLLRLRKSGAEQRLWIHEEVGAAAGLQITLLVARPSPGFPQGCVSASPAGLVTEATPGLVSCSLRLWVWERPECS